MYRENWIKSFGPDKEMHTLEEKNGVVMYLTRDRSDNPYPRAPNYHVWNGDNWIYCGPYERMAYEVYDSALGEVNA